MQAGSLFFNWDSNLNNVALESERGQWSYRQLSQSVEVLASHLLSQGNLVAARPIVLLFDNNVEYVTAFLAALKLGTVMPVNPKLPLEQVVTVLAPLKPAMILYDAAHVKNAELLAAELQMFCYEVTISAQELTDAEQVHDVIVERKEDDVALILHTSGTTAKPKCVPLTYKNLAENINNIVTTLQLNATDRNLNMMPLFHIHGIVASMLSTLASGGTFILKEINYKNIASQLKMNKPTWFTAVPTIHHKIYQELVRDGDQADAAKTLRFVRSCSSALSQGLQQKMQILLNVPIIQAYGMTEAAHQVASNPLEIGATKLLSVGKPTGTIVVIVDDNGNILGSDAIGEVCIKGKNVFSGYWDNPQANQDSFVHGYFRTGDLGYLDAEGYLFLTGRKKELINKGGFKISPLQIDQIVLQHPGVSEAITFAIPHETLGDDIGLMVVPAASELSEQTVYEHLAEHLADYMLPSKVFIVDEIPKSATGKINRLSIFGLLSEVHMRRQPQNAMEAELKSLWENILMIPMVYTDDNFFQLGGNSLSAAELYRYLLERYQIQLLPIAIYQSPTIIKMAELILQHTSNRQVDWLYALEEVIKRYEV